MNQFFERYASWGYPQKEIKLPSVIRLNTLKKSAEAIFDSFDRKIKLEKIPFLPLAYTATASFSLASTMQYIKGEIYIQEVASQLAVLALDVKPGDLVLDVAAAPGSKTTYIAQIMNNQGNIVANDVSGQRLKVLEMHLERCGVTNTTVVQEDARLLAFSFKFDKVLVDAPCSGNFATDETWLERRKIEEFTQMSFLQKEILERATTLVKPGGILLYTTCSLEQEENEQVVEWVLENLPLELVPIDGIGDGGLTHKTKLCKRLWPSIHETQGFFMAKFKRTQ